MAPRFLGTITGSPKVMFYKVGFSWFQNPGFKELTGIQNADFNLTIVETFLVSCVSKRITGKERGNKGNYKYTILLDDLLPCRLFSGATVCVCVCLHLPHQSLQLSVVLSLFYETAFPSL